MAKQCPRCGSQNVVSCPIAYEQGVVTTTTTTKGTIHSRTLGTGMGPTVGGMMASGVHATSQTHRSVRRSAFAERASPPVNPIWLPLKGIAGAIVFGIVLVLADKLISMPVWLGLADVAATLLCAVWAVFAFLRLSDYRARRARWEKAWICGVCGSQFIPAA